MEDGCVSVTVGHLTGVVSSAHLVEPKKINCVNVGCRKTPSMTIDSQDSFGFAASMAAGAGQLRQVQGLQGSTWADLSLCHAYPEEHSPSITEGCIERWAQRAGSGLERDLACDRGTVAHEHCEYVLKTAAKLARQSANKKGSWKVWDDGLARPPKAVTNWAPQESEGRFFKGCMASP